MNSVAPMTRRPSTIRRAQQVGYGASKGWPWLTILKNVAVHSSPLPRYLPEGTGLPRGGRRPPRPSAIGHRNCRACRDVRSGSRGEDSSMPEIRRSGAWSASHAGIAPEDPGVAVVPSAGFVARTIATGEINECDDRWRGVGPRRFGGALRIPESPAAGGRWRRPPRSPGR